MDAFNKLSYDVTIRSFFKSDYWRLYNPKEAVTYIEVTSVRLFYLAIFSFCVYSRKVFATLLRRRHLSAVYRADVEGKVAEPFPCSTKNG